MKKTIIKFAVCLVALCAALSVLGSSAVYAWLAINNVVEQNALNISVKVTPNLVVAEQKTDLPTISLSSSGTYHIKGELTAESLVPCTRYETLGMNKHTPESSLVYLVNTGDVDPNTGVINGGTYEYAHVTDAIKSSFYVEKTVYLASVGELLTDYDLRVSIGNGSLGTTSLSSEEQSVYINNNFKAASVDFLISTDGENFVYRDTLNLAHLDAAQNTGSAVKTAFAISDVAIPINTNPTGCLAIKMLFYYDGSLINSSKIAFVNTKTVKNIPAILDISFEATPKAST